jgi:hypothetical protein
MMLAEAIINYSFSIVPYELGLNRLGGEQSAGSFDALSLVKWTAPYRVVFSNIILPAIFVFLAGRISAGSSSGYGFSPFVLPILAVAAVFTLWNWAQSGWLPRVYAATWSQGGLEIHLFGSTHAFDAGAPVEAKRMPLVAALRSPGGRWYPLPSEVFDRLVERRNRSVSDGFDRV